MNHPETTEVTCPAGTVVGCATETTRSFHSIPYSRISALFNDAVPAPAASLIDATLPRPDSTALSITTPAHARPGADLPVMVFIHGGRFEEGSHADSTTGAEGFARQGVIQVRIGYRLRLAGLLQFPDDVASHFRAAHDCQLALEWVQRNIESFGGDPTNVTLVGQSAGAALVLWLARRDHFRGGFRRALVMSPAFPRVTSSRRRTVLRAALGKPLTRAALNNAAATRVERAYRRLRTAYFTDMALGPGPLDAAELAEVDLVVTSTREEMHRSGSRIDSIGLGAAFVRTVGAAMGLKRQRASAYLKAARRVAPGHLAGQLIGDSLIRRWVDQVAEGAPGRVWQAEFASASSSSPVHHCDDLVHLFTEGTALNAWVVDFCHGRLPTWPEYRNDDRSVARIAADGTGCEIVKDPLGYVREAFGA
ncbi:carboxylesterase family protein [Corynebacterium sp. LK2510]|uniref:carboxylesterase family protein n=1 Tax=Corynebacterium sp. LK2510 TaxID=3110472 RepID=UPI0034CD5A9A